MFVWNERSKTSRDFYKIQPCTGLALDSCYINTRIPGRQTLSANYFRPEKTENAFDISSSSASAKNKELNRRSKNMQK